MTHIALLVSVAVAALVCGILLGLFIMGKVADDVMGKALDAYVDEQMKAQKEKQQ
jgi:uncharacterized protein YneF (UPF0154 family)